MDRIRMFLDQRRSHRLILYIVVFDVAVGYFLKYFEAVRTPLLMAMVYLANLLVILAVYRFWIVPLFECDASGFIVYGISPFKKDICAWEQLEYVCFKEMEEKKGRMREFMLLHYVLPGGIHKTNMVPMYMVGFNDKIKEEFLGFMKKKGLENKCQPGL